MKKIDAAKIPSKADLEAEIERRVEERLLADPRLAEAQIVQARSAVNEEFARIEQERGISLSQEVRQHIVDEAVRRGTNDLELVLDSEMYRRQQKKQRASQKQRSAPSRPTTPQVTQEGSPEGTVESVEEAMARAFAEMGAA